MRMTNNLHPDKVSFLEQKAKIMRRHVVESIGRAGSGHPGGSLSCVDILAALYFGDILAVKPKEPLWPLRDRFVLSKGHAAPALYAALAERGFFPKEELLGLRRMGSMLQGHPDCRKTPGIDASTGSLGQGLSIAIGMALAARLDGHPYKAWALLGDGECQEGQVWEAAMSAAHYKLGNLVAILDHNKLQIDGPVAKVMSPEPLPDKWKAFGWDVIEADGHDMGELYEIFLKVKKRDTHQPTMIIAETVKGKGVSFMEGVVDWHGKAPSPEEVEKALCELSNEGVSE